MEQRVGIIRALFRYLRFWNWRQARFILDATDAQFTGDVQGIAYAFDIHSDDLIAQYNGLRNAVAQVEVVLEQKRTRLHGLNDKEAVLIRQREGALSRAESEKDPAEMEKHKVAFERFQNQISEIEAEQAKLETEISEISASMKKHMYQLTKLQSEVQRLPEQKANAIADHVTANQIIALNDRLNGLQSSIDRGPIEAVLKANRELTAKARITEKLAGTDVRLQDEEYAQAGSQSVSNTSFDQLLAARKAEREAKTGVKTEPATVSETGDSRPRI
ncbi:MAG: hypothetical protein A3B86_04770 [Candidatus Yanofskybacteria bacterium RIFCSPHIGHO2_02_FULL_38_22b]|uniref:Uncharacterized protein n=1 Tax=Candidatus Yanofskybacteria bacterium RIFCSPHIGHO2_02_FULL_38_22b TaxID=1802673 RepID=A0A1F8F5K4_9BACT|nr:MAG: hypothetical protein A2816_01245 [Candidatus Yanofskybacteria bacterium RIFCSPHIGHO2_01_FULL_39_44]OGN07526.1 MAG: hypothetical protein A3B86_04770 [Candidatus Yanofskybacteria bacterium RIFCSPHIGHO2_02_FULL_38_22b]